MPAITYVFIALGSFALYGALFTFGVLNTSPNGSWHTAWCMLLALDAVGAGECGIILIVLWIRRWLGYPEEQVG